LVIKALDPDWIRIRIGVYPKMLDPDPDEMNADPQPWLGVYSLSIVETEVKMLPVGSSMRIRIQHFRSMRILIQFRIRIQSFDDQKL
jgi:hypothetical protein